MQTGRLKWLKTTLPYVHESKCSNVWRVCVGDETHQLFASQLECKQFVQQTESSRHNATSPNSTYLKENGKHINAQDKTEKKDLVGNRTKQVCKFLSCSSKILLNCI